MKGKSVIRKRKTIVFPKVIKLLSQRSETKINERFGVLIRPYPIDIMKPKKEIIKSSIEVTKIGIKIKRNIFDKEEEEEEEEERNKE